MVFLSNMTPKRFGQLCSDPALLQADDAGVLKEVLTVYPFVNEARMLQACWDAAFGNEEEKNDLSKTSLFAGNRLIFSFMLYGKTEPEPEFVPPADEIIERFLKKEPRIVMKKDFSPPADERVDRSVVDEGGMVSETLARIHANQGSYRKAIEIYNKLSLKFPGKSSYFAARIKELEDKLGK